MSEIDIGSRRISSHPILQEPERDTIEFSWEGRTLPARQGECIATALFANGIHIFGYHPKDKSPQGIFCANGQCSQCMVIADGLAVKSCMEPVKAGMKVEPVEGLPELPPVEKTPDFREVEEIEVECLIIGGGPSGLSAATELGKIGVDVLLVDDKDRLGGKLVLQTHKFFGSIDDCHAGTRGTDIATLLETEVKTHSSVKCWLNTNAVAVYSDQRVGLVRDGNKYVLVKPKTILVSTGAREKSITFRGNTLPGVYGAGAFQTLVNRDLVRPSEKLFIVGGGNVGLIAGYHALQAGIKTVGLVEALPACGGYKVHIDKLVRFGVPIYTRHTVVSANGTDHVESVTIAEIDSDWNVIPGTEKSFECDTLLIAVGLDPVDEFYKKAVAFGMQAFAAGDASEIAEASAAMFSGKIQGIKIARELGKDVPDVPEDWGRIERVLKSKPGTIEKEDYPDELDGVFPVFHCSQEIPCNPCTSVCSISAIKTGEDIRGRPHWVGKELGEECTGCTKCVTICPGLAITLVNTKKDAEFPTVTIAHEFLKDEIKAGDHVTVLDTEGTPLGQVEVFKVTSSKKLDRTLLIRVKAPKAIATKIAGIQVQEPEVTEPMEQYVTRMTDDTIVCRCERVTVGQIRDLIKSGIRDVNEIKTATRAAMGACGAKTCGSIIKFLFRQEGIPMEDVTDNVDRPLFVEVPLGVFCGTEEEG
jgi:sarcosine oxidase subunit alpha